MSDYNWKDFLAKWRKERQELDDRFSYFYGNIFQQLDSYQSAILNTIESLIAEIEARIGKTLPSSYREFLQVVGGEKFILPTTNSWSAVPVDWFVKKYQKSLEYWIENLEPERAPENNFDIYGRAQKLTVSQKDQFLATLAVADDGKQIYLLNPLVETSQGEWEAWSLDLGSHFFTKYPSFWEMMQQKYDQFHERAKAIWLSPEYVSVSGSDKLLPVYDWKQFLQYWSECLIESGGAFYNAFDEDEIPLDVVKSKWVGYPPVTETQLLEAETHLGKLLPPSYRQFLMVTNGWPYYHHSILVEIWKLEQINWFEQKDKAIGTFSMVMDAVKTGNWQLPEIPDEEYFDYSKQKGFNFRLDHFKAALEIGGFDGNDYYLLNPLAINQNGEWEAWTWSHEDGAQRYPSFWEMMQEIYYRMVFL